MHSKRVKILVLSLFVGTAAAVAERPPMRSVARVSLPDYCSAVFPTDGPEAKQNLAKLRGQFMERFAAAVKDLPGGDPSKAVNFESYLQDQGYFKEELPRKLGEEIAKLEKSAQEALKKGLAENEKTGGRTTNRLLTSEKEPKIYCDGLASYVEGREKDIDRVRNSDLSRIAYDLRKLKDEKYVALTQKQRELEATVEFEFRALEPLRLESKKKADEFEYGKKIALEAIYRGLGKYTGVYHPSAETKRQELSNQVPIMTNKFDALIAGAWQDYNEKLKVHEARAKELRQQGEEATKKAIANLSEADRNALYERLSDGVHGMRGVLDQYEKYCADSKLAKKLKEHKDEMARLAADESFLRDEQAMQSRLASCQQACTNPSGRSEPNDLMVSVHLGILYPSDDKRKESPKFNKAHAACFQNDEGLFSQHYRIAAQTVDVSKIKPEVLCYEYCPKAKEDARLETGCYCNYFKVLRIAERRNGGVAGEATDGVKNKVEQAPKQNHN